MPSHMPNPQGGGVQAPPQPQAPINQHPPEARSQFMARVYTNLVVGIAAFIGLEFVLFSDLLIAPSPAERIFNFVVDTNWLLVLGGFMLVSWLASHLAKPGASKATQWGGYALLVAANALLFVAPLYIANEAFPGTITLAAQISIVGFAALSAIAIYSGKDFSFLRSFLMWGGVVALGLIVASVLFGMELGTWFSVAMIAFAGGAILYDTQKIYRSMPPGSEVVSAMHLFSSVALLFWYVLRLLMSRD